MSRRRGGYSGTAGAARTAAKEEQSKSEPQETQPKDNYSALDELLAPDVIVQLFILCISIHFAFAKYGGFQGPFFLHFQNCAIIVIAILVSAYSKYKSSGYNPGTLPKFQVFYSFYLPFMLSLLFNERLTLVNSALVLNIVEIPLPFRIPMQWMLIQLQAPEDSPKAPIQSFLAIIINYVFSIVLAKISHLKSLDNVDCSLFSILLTDVLFLIQSDSIYFQVLKNTLLAFLIVVSFNYVMSFLLSSFSDGYMRSIMLFTSFVAGTPFIIKKLLIIDEKDPLDWLLDYISGSKTRITILSTWLISLFVLVPNILIFKSNFSLNTSRKVWHFLILLLISKPFLMDPEFVKISLAGTIVLFLTVEYLRYLKLQPFGEYLDARLRLFSDFRDDKGPIIISYIYLIIGVTAPLLIANSPVGLISLGVGDSLASIIGGKWGKRYWPGTTKTVEGTLAFVVSTSATMYFFKENLGYFNGISHTNLCIVCLLSGLLEGNSTLNDNILIPAFMLIIERLLCE
ncbi:hypothetical protein HG535_0G03580 [Zygotorulaspora mrakii]|uniref:dolichol kinase n=1 Tax=Zygotorulaspora mrakii TaxID=42260 RepID=A0A7H9B6X4_ZYGMR|nr:uncharacterized protein HG535_0G03580 [Zygotorulaspora mrakii]QLG74475.1 hypothetical protein HG535_0G03580 [Zygotorulaspora mrakii]